MYGCPTRSSAFLSERIDMNTSMPIQRRCNWSQTTQRCTQWQRLCILWRPGLGADGLQVRSQGSGQCEDDLEADLEDDLFCNLFLQRRVVDGCLLSKDKFRYRYACMTQGWR
jgi:hypothetical protein